MQSLLLGLHNILRWLVLLTAVVALIRAFRGVVTNAPWTHRESLSLRAYTIVITIQMLVGLTLYFFLSPVGVQAFGDVGSAMRDPAVRYFAVEHPIAMMLGVAFAHIAVARTRKATTDASRYRAAALLVTLSLVLVLARMPWGRPLFPTF